MQSHFVLPVIHYLDAETTLAQADIAFECGADGVFLISHGGMDDDLYMPTMTIKGRYPTKMIGVNFLSKGPVAALEAAVDVFADMVWVDSPEVDSAGVGPIGAAVVRTLKNCSARIRFFGSVAFKYQAYERDPSGAAVQVAIVGMVPTTSGLATGKAPDIEKIAGMSKALLATGQPPELAVASGLTPENIFSYMPFASHFLVATGVSLDDHHFDPARLKLFVENVKTNPLYRTN